MSVYQTTWSLERKGTDENDPWSEFVYVNRAITDEPIRLDVGSSYDGEVSLYLNGQEAFDLAMALLRTVRESTGVGPLR